MFQNIMVAVDGSDHALRAVAAAAELTELTGARLTIVSVTQVQAGKRLPSHLRAFDAIEHSAMTASDFQHAKAVELLERATESISDRSIEAQTVVLDGVPAKQIVQHAKDVEADLIVMGRRGLSDLQGLLVGSVSHKVSHMVDCAVLLVQ